jgi:hypothetical protein
MANPLTGEYEAVLQVSEATINRLLASMHQNAWKDPNTPSFPHSIGVELGKHGVVDGVQGWVNAQVAVPRIHLVDGSTDAFDIEVGLRARYLPNDGTTPLPTYIHGTLRARYQVNPIDPSCLGWGNVASHYLWFRVVESSVRFTGSYGEDTLLAALIDKDEANAAVTKQLAHLLVKDFEPTPHKVNANFRPPQFKSILERNQLVSEAAPPGIEWVPDVPLGGAAVLVPLGVYQDPPAGALDSLEHVLLGDSDFAVIISQGVVNEALQPTLDAMQQFRTSTPLVATGILGTDHFSYDTTINPNSVHAAWLPNDTYGRIVITADGHSHCDDWEKPDFDFSLIQPLHLEFDPGSEGLALWAESGTVYIRTSPGLPLPDFIWDEIKPTVQHQIQNAVANAVADAQSTLAQFSTGSAQLAKQLQKMDGKADAHFDQASFYLSGVVFRGRVSVARRRKPQVDFAKIDGETFSALNAWIPGGRIDEFQWKWSTNASWSAPFQDHDEPTDRYVLKRQPGDMTPFGMSLRGEPLPGLDGSGKVCMSVVGKAVNPDTGAFDIDVETDDVCRRFGFVGPFRGDEGRIYVPEYDLAVPPDDHPHHPGPVEVGVVDITARSEDHVVPANTLVVVSGDSFSEEHARVIVDGLAGCIREDAGLLVSIVLSEGALDGPDGDRARSLRAMAQRLPAPMIVNEDLGGTWSTALSIDRDAGDTAWRLISPGGGVLWAREGEVDAGELASVLDGCLYPSPAATPSAVKVEREWSAGDIAALVGAVHTHPPHEVARNCPSTFTVGAEDMGLVVSGVAFVRKDSASSSSEMTRLRTENADRGENDPQVLVIVDGATESEAHRMGEELGPGFMVVPDPDGSVAAGAGVRYWPTTIAVDKNEGVWR